MHGPALTSAHAGFLAKQLSHQWCESCAFGYRVTVRAVITGYVVILAKHHASTDDLTFLSARVVQHS